MGACIKTISRTLVKSQIWLQSIVTPVLWEMETGKWLGLALQAQWKTLFQGGKAENSKARCPISSLTCKGEHVSAQTLHIYSSQHTQRCKFNKHIGRILSSQITKTFKAKWEYRVSSRSAWETWWGCFIILIKVKKRAENIYLACGRPWVWSLLLQKGKMHSIKLRLFSISAKAHRSIRNRNKQTHFSKKKKKALNHTQWSKNKNSFKMGKLLS